MNARSFDSDFAAILISLFAISNDAFCKSKFKKSLLTCASVTGDNKTVIWRGLLDILHWVFIVLWYGAFQLRAHIYKILIEMRTDISFISGYFIVPYYSWRANTTGWLTLTNLLPCGFQVVFAHFKVFTKIGYCTGWLCLIKLVWEFFYTLLFYSGQVRESAS